MAVKNIEKKKLQNFLIAVIIIVCSMIFSTSLSMMKNIDKTFEEMYEKSNASHDILFFEEKNYDIHKVQNWWNNQDEIEQTQVFLSYYLTGMVEFKDKKISTGMRIVERPSINITQDKISIVEGEKKNAPAHGEIWIPTGYAYYNHINVGDILTIPAENKNIDMRVSAIVVDPHYSTPSIEPTRAWIAQGDLVYLYPSKTENSYIFGIKYKNYSKASKLWKKFNEYLKTPFNGQRMKYTTFYVSNTYEYKIIGSVLFVVALMIIVVTLCIIAFTISNAVLSDYKIIGILKSQGFTPRHITVMYGGQFMTLSIISIPIGVFLSYFVIQRISSNLLKSLGITNMNLSMISNFIITFCVLTLIIFLGAVISSIKAGKIKPSEAIRRDAPQKNYSSDGRISFISMKKISLSLALGIKQAFSNKKQSLFLVIVVCMTVSITVFTINIYDSLIKIGKNMAFIGYDNSQVMMRCINKNTVKSSEDILGELKKDHRVKVVVPWGWYESAVMPEYKEIECESIYPYIYDGDMDSIGIRNIEGRNPKTNNEVSLAINTSKKYNKSVGDYIDIYINGSKKNFLVVGVYQLLFNGGEGFRAKALEIKENDSLLKLNNYSICLNEGVDIKNFIEDMKDKYKGKFEIKESGDFLSSILDDIIESSLSCIVFISGIFILISLIAIFNSILMNVYEEKKNYGIYKTLGMTSKQIRLSIIYKTIILTSIGIVPGIILGIIMPPKILKIILSIMSMMHYPVEVNVGGILLAIPITIAVYSICAWIASGKVMDIDLRSLMEE